MKMAILRLVAFVSSFYYALRCQLLDEHSSRFIIGKIIEDIQEERKAALWNKEFRKKFEEDLEKQSSPRINSGD